MSSHSINRRLSVLAVAASTAAALSLPAAASAKPIFDSGPIHGTAPQDVRTVTDDGQSLAIPLGGGMLAVVLTGAGLMAFRHARPRAPQPIR